MKKKKSFVEDYAGYNFLQNPFEKGTHIFTCLSGEFVCVSPSSGDRFKYQSVLRHASEEEVVYYRRKLGLNTIEE